MTTTILEVETTKYGCNACGEELQAASNVEGMRHLGCQKHGVFTRKFFWSKGIHVLPDGRVLVTHYQTFQPRDIQLRSYHPSLSSKRRVAHLLNHHPENLTVSVHADATFSFGICRYEG